MMTLESGIRWYAITMVVAVSALSFPATAQTETEAKPIDPLRVRLTERLPSARELRDPSVAEQWPAKRREMAGRIWFEEKPYTLRRLVRVLGERKVKGRGLVIVCSSTQTFGRAREVAQAVSGKDLGLDEICAALPKSEGDSFPFRVPKSFAADFTRIFSGFGSGVITIGGDPEPDPVPEDAPADDEPFVEPEPEPEEAASYVEVRVTTSPEGTQVSVGRNSIPLENRKELRERLRAAIDVADETANRIVANFQSEDDVPFGDYAAVRRFLDGLDFDEIALTPSFTFAFDSTWQARWETGSRAWIADEIDAGLAALAKTQSPSGRWSGDHGDIDDVGRTGLALFAFMAEFHTPEEGKYKDVVASGLQFLIRDQQETGAFAASEGAFTVNHLMATRALIEAYGVTGDERYENPARQALRLALRARREDGAWSATDRPAADLILTTWAAMCLKSGDDCGLDFGDGATEKTMRWIDAATAEDGTTSADSGLEFGIDRFHGRHAESATATSLILRNRLGADSEDLAAQEKRVLAEGPTASGSGLPDLEYLFFGSLALNDVGSTHWDSWRRELDVAIFRHLAEVRGDDEADVFMGSARRDSARLQGADPAVVAYLTASLISSYRFSQSFEAPK